MIYGATTTHTASMWKVKKKNEFTQKLPHCVGISSLACASEEENKCEIVNGWKIKHSSTPRTQVINEISWSFKARCAVLCCELWALERYIRAENMRVNDKKAKQKVQVGSGQEVRWNRKREKQTSAHMCISFSTFDYRSGQRTTTNRECLMMRDFWRAFNALSSVFSVFFSWAWWWQWKTKELHTISHFSVKLIVDITKSLHVSLSKPQPITFRTERRFGVAKTKKFQAFFFRLAQLDILVGLARKREVWGNYRIFSWSTAEKLRQQQAILWMARSEGEWQMATLSSTLWWAEKL